jgi:MPBQ/MSBQ methyltransferase
MTDTEAGWVPSFSARYDALILAPDKRALYGSDFFNVGWWARGATTLAAACEALTAEHARLVEAAGPPTGYVLDIGCGLGGGSAVLTRRWPQARVIGVNISATQLQFARSRHPSALFCAMDAMHLGIADGAVEAIVSVEAAQHFPSRRTFLAEARRALSAGGRLVFSDLLGADPQILGEWSLPEANGPSDLRTYAALCRDSGFYVDHLCDVTNATWHGFCAYLADQSDTVSLAEMLRTVVSGYVLASLRSL